MALQIVPFHAILRNVQNCDEFVFTNMVNAAWLLSSPISDTKGISRMTDVLSPRLPDMVLPIVAYMQCWIS
jgi:hypothetical protein